MLKTEDPSTGCTFNPWFSRRNTSLSFKTTTYKSISGFASYDKWVKLYHDSEFEWINGLNIYSLWWSPSLYNALRINSVLLIVISAQG
jgi:hypothetical protein